MFYIQILVTVDLMKGDIIQESLEQSILFQVNCSGWVDDNIIQVIQGIFDYVLIMFWLYLGLFKNETITENTVQNATLVSFILF